MGSPFSLLLEATLEHLTNLRSGGVQFVPIDPAILKALAQPLPKARLPLPDSGYRAIGAPASRTSPLPRRAPAQTPAPPTPSTPVAMPATATPSPVDSTVPSGPVAGASSTSIARAAALEALRQRALVCQKCAHLVQFRTQVVFGVGSPDAQLMFVGEAPGAHEDRRGEPFVGPAGQLLTRMIQAMGLTRESVYIANILKCRPDVPPGTPGNRAPRPEEMATCKPYLLSQIEIIQPRLIVALGGTAVQGLLGLTTTMGAVRGRWQTFQGIPVMPTYHPSYLLHSEDRPDRGHGEKRKTWEDMLMVLERLQWPITDKMRTYFLKSPSGDSAG